MRCTKQWVRVSRGKEATPSVAITNSQSVRIGSTQSEPQAVGCDAGKKVKGRKQHILVDTWGLLMVVVVTAANIAEREGAKLVLAKSQSHYLHCLRFSPMLVMMVCQCSNGLWILTIGAGRLSNAPIRRLVLYLCLNARWSLAQPAVGIRTFGWFNWSRRLSKDYKILTDTSEAFLHIAMIRLSLRRLA